MTKEGTRHLLPQREKEEEGYSNKSSSFDSAPASCASIMQATKSSPAASSNSALVMPFSLASSTQRAASCTAVFLSGEAFSGTFFATHSSRKVFALSTLICLSDRRRCSYPLSTIRQ